MSIVYKLWCLAQENNELKQRLSKKLNIHEVISQVLINRGITDEKDAKQFLFGGVEFLLDSFLLKDMEKGVKRIADAISRQEKITVYGDYDVDGITSSALLCRTLRRLGAQVQYYIPERLSEGYGLNKNALDRIYQEGTTLVITVDCGISSFSEVADMKSKLDIVVTDHHQPPLELPPAYAIINPKQKDCGYPDKNLAGVGVAFKLCQALWQYFYQGSQFTEDMDLVAIGTVADIVPLLGENRILVKEGIKALNQTSNIGLQALLACCDLTGKADSGNIGFVLAPRLNAAGRMCNASDGVKLLMTDDYEEAKALSVFLDDENKQRQTMERTILEEALLLLEETSAAHDKVIVLAKDDWHPGVIGIVASRLVEKYYRPVIMISIKDGVGKGSCRSIKGFDMHQALSRCSSLLVKFGGHKQAAGLTVLSEHIDNFRQAINDLAQEMLTAEDYLSVIQVDALISSKDIDFAFIDQVTTLAPFGMGNPSPNFACHKVLVNQVRTIGQEGKHLKLQIKEGTAVRDVVGWNMGSFASELRSNQQLDLIFVPEINEWKDKKYIQLKAKDLSDDRLDPETKKIFDNLAPDRTIIGQIYLLLKRSLSKNNSSMLTNPEIVQAMQQVYHTDIEFDGVERALTVLTEIGLLRIEQNDTRRIIFFNAHSNNKLNLLDSKTFREGMVKRELYINIGGLIHGI